MKMLLAFVTLCSAHAMLNGQQPGMGSSANLATEASCKAAIKYLESPDGLLGDWDRITKQNAAYRSGLTLEIKLRDTLLSESWWATSQGPEVANQIRGICNTFNDVIGVLSPEGNPARLAETFGDEVSKRSTQILTSVSKGSDLYTSLKEGTDGLAMFGIKLAGEQAGVGRAESALAVLQDIQTTKETADDIEEAKSTVQKQANIINAFIVEFTNRRDETQHRLETIEGMREAVNKACSITAAKKIEQQNAARAEGEEDDEKSKDKDRSNPNAGFAEKHAEWELRNNHRKAEMKKLEDAADNITDETQRHSALDDALKQISRLQAEGRLDPEPKPINQP